MPFGLTNSPTTFQSLLYILLAGYRWLTCLVYLDAIIVFSQTFEENLHKVREILSVLKHAACL